MTKGEDPPGGHRHACNTVPSNVAPAPPARGRGGAGVVNFPLSAVVGADDLRLALLLNAVSPTLGGVLVRGEKGTAKSTAVRGLAALLPGVEVIVGCRFACAPSAPDPDCPDGPHPGGAAHATRAARLVELPVGASEDRVTGSVDLDRALAEGISVLRPGLLAAAHRGILYVDEVNLLGDHLVDLLLDAAALGVAHVERDGVSVRHPASFLLVGTMNPEEGELRPQLLDRFGLTVGVAASRDPVLRAQVVRRRLAFEADPVAFATAWAPAEAALAAQVADARTRLRAVTLTDAALRAVSTVCAGVDVDGMRADVVLAKTAMALAAWSGHGTVRAGDIRAGARLALPHRRRRGPFDAPDLDDATLDAVLDAALDGLDATVDAELADPATAATRTADGDTTATSGDGRKVRQDPTGDDLDPNGHTPHPDDDPDGDGPHRGGPDRGGPDSGGTPGDDDRPGPGTPTGAGTGADGRG
ncbi:ATP-binding protein, partial [Frankia tisae]|uniref:ATP-binding protein n=1 Tax=Frankia tisae TaxID=2950104 RepID=UPI00355795A1